MTDDKLKQAIDIYNSISDKEVTDNYKVEYRTDIYFLKALTAYSRIMKPDDDGYYMLGQKTAELISSGELRGGTVSLASSRLAANNQIDYKFEYGRRNYRLKSITNKTKDDEVLERLAALVNNMNTKQ